MTVCRKNFLLQSLTTSRRQGLRGSTGVVVGVFARKTDGFPKFVGAGCVFLRFERLNLWFGFDKKFLQRQISGIIRGKNSTSGNRTRGVCVTGRNVTNYTNTDILSVKQPSTFLILRTPILKERDVPSRPKSHPSIILQWLSHIPSDIIGPNQYCGEPRPMLLVLIASLLSTLGLRCGAFNPWPFCSRFATSF